MDRLLLEDVVSVLSAAGDLPPHLVVAVGTILPVRMTVVSVITIGVIVTALEARMTGIVR